MGHKAHIKLLGVTVASLNESVLSLRDSLRESVASLQNSLHESVASLRDSSQDSFQMLISRFDEMEKRADARDRRSNSISPSSAGGTGEADAHSFICQIGGVQSLVDAIGSVRGKSQPDAIIELSKYGIVINVKRSDSLLGKVYLKRQSFLAYHYAPRDRLKFGLKLGLFVDCLKIFSAPGLYLVIEICYSGPDTKLLLKSIHTPDNFSYAEIQTSIPDTSLVMDHGFEPTGNVPVSFIVRAAVLKEVIDNLSVPKSRVHICIRPNPPMVTFITEGHDDLPFAQIDLEYRSSEDIFLSFQCNQMLSYRYKCKNLRAAFSKLPICVLNDNRGSKVTFGMGGMLKIQHLVTLLGPGGQHPSDDFNQQLRQTSHLEFFVKSEGEVFVKPNEKDFIKPEENLSNQRKKRKRKRVNLHRT